MRYDAFLLVSFGGPEGPDDVMPFLRTVTKGRGVPEERLAEVAEHYQHFGGVSPINAQCRDLLAAIGVEFAAHGLDLPGYWGNRNWTPLLVDTLARMRDDGVRRALAFVTSPYASYSACRQYLEDIEAARATLGPDAPVVDKIRHYHDHPGHIEPHVAAVRAALARLGDPDPAGTRLVFTAHSVPAGMAAASGALTDGVGHRYERQLREVAALVADRAAPGYGWDLVWQSRSGPPQVPWLAPDVNEHLASLAGTGVRAVLVSPIGFTSDHLEVCWDLDIEAAATAARLGLDFARAATPGTHPRFVTMIRELVRERLDPGGTRLALGDLPGWDTCRPGCCVPVVTGRQQPAGTLTP